MIDAYPLKWPKGWPRTDKPIQSRFSTSLAAALKNVRESLVAFGKDSGKPTQEIVISSNVSLGQDNPKDTGVAVWFMWEDKQLCIAVDRYKKVQENLQAIHLIIESRRTELRHGGLHLLRQAFAEFKALPAASGKDCWSILGISVTDEKKIISEAYKKLSRERHPDMPGGSETLMRELNQAYQGRFIGFKNNICGVDIIYEVSEIDNQRECFKLYVEQRGVDSECTMIKFSTMSEAVYVQDILIKYMMNKFS